MVIEPSQPAEMADVDSEVDSEVVRQHAVWSGWGRSCSTQHLAIRCIQYSMQFSSAYFAPFLV